MHKPTQDDIAFTENWNACKQAFIDFIRDRMGISIQPYQEKDFKKTIQIACENYSYSPLDYLNQLKMTSDQSPLLNNLITNVTIGETYFFRDKKQMRLLQETILPKIIHEKRAENNLILRIWSAGCASGEEIYTIAMMLYELLPDIDKWKLNLLATDINPDALQKGIAGIYREWSMRSINPYYKKRYFVQEKDQYHLLPALRNLVCFNYLNLSDNSYPSLFTNTNAQDLILCRNVLIYFDANIGKQLFNKLSLSLRIGGFLLLGASDPIYNDETINLKLHNTEGLLFSRFDPDYDLVNKAKSSNQNLAAINRQSAMTSVPYKNTKNLQQTSGEQTMQQAHREQTMQQAHREQTMQQAHREQTMQQAHREQTMQQTHREQTMQQTHREQTMQQAHREQTMQQMHREQTMQQAHREQTMQQTYREQATKLQSTQQQSTKHSLHETIKNLLVAKNWQAILENVIEVPSHAKDAAFLIDTKAIALANLGQIQAAAALAKKNLVTHPTNKSVHFTYALILIELNQLVEAEIILKQTLFIDNQFVPAHFHLGLLNIRNKKYQEGLKNLKNALRIVEQHNPSENAYEDRVCSYAELAKMLKREIDLYSNLEGVNYSNEETKS